ncbi:MAG: hypothetical protein ABI680_16645 [Chthoniobacteraceae bacterium]
MKSRLFTTFCLLAVSAATASAATLDGLWLFDDSNDLAHATVGTDLTFTGAAPGTWSATVPDDQGVSLSGVITTPAADQGNQFIATHGIAPNGGGAFVNQYSIVVDLFSPLDSRASWRTILQTSPTNSNDGDFFIAPDDDAIGVAAIEYSDLPIDETSWSRLVVTFDLGFTIQSYIDGAPFYTHLGDSLDGRFSLDPTVLFFSDEDGENAPLNIGALAIYDGVLTLEEVSALGVAGSAINIPEPGTGALILAALPALLRRRRS